MVAFREGWGSETKVPKRRGWAMVSGMPSIRKVFRQGAIQVYLYVLGPLSGIQSEALRTEHNAPDGEYQPWARVTINGAEFDQMVWNPEPGTDVRENPSYRL